MDPPDLQCQHSSVSLQDVRLALSIKHLHCVRAADRAPSSICLTNVKPHRKLKIQGVFSALSPPRSVEAPPPTIVQEVSVTKDNRAAAKSTGTPVALPPHVFPVATGRSGCAHAAVEQWAGWPAVKRRLCC